MKNFLPAHVRIWRGFLRKKKLFKAPQPVNSFFLKPTIRIN